MECTACGTQWVNPDVTVPCPRCQGVGKNITPMSTYKVLKALPSTMNQYEAGAVIELSDAEVGGLVEDGTLELVEKTEEATPEAPIESEVETKSDEDLEKAEVASSTPSANEDTDCSATSSSGKKYEIYLANLDLTLPVVSIDEEAGKATIRVADVPEAIAKNAGLEGEFATYWYGENAGGNTISEVTE